MRLFENVQATEQNLFLYSLVFLLTLAALLWYLVSVKACTRISLIALVLFVPEIVLGRSSLFGAVLMLTSITGVWLFAFHAGSFRRRTGWTIVTGLILFLHALDIRRKNLTDSTESEKGRSTDDRTAAIWRG